MHDSLLRFFGPARTPPRLLAQATGGVLLVCALAMFGCASDRAIPDLDELAWLAQLRRRRPELLVESGAGVRDPGWQALVIQPELRDELLASTGATWSSLVNERYSASLRADDEVWRASLQAFAMELGADGEIHAGPSS